MKLYEINAAIETALNPPEGEEIDHEALESLKLSFDDKVEGCLAIIKNLKAEEAALDTEIKRLQARKKAVENNRKSLSDYTQFQLEVAGMKGVAVGVHKARIAKSPDGLIVMDEADIPESFKHIETKIDKRGILKHFKETGEILPGTEIETDRTHLRIS